MKSYRLVVRQQGRIVGHFETSGWTRWKISAWRERCLASLAAISASCKCPIPNAGCWRVARMG